MHGQVYPMVDSVDVCGEVKQTNKLVAEGVVQGKRRISLECDHFIWNWKINLRDIKVYCISLFFSTNGTMYILARI